MIGRIQKAALLVALISTGLLFIVGPFYAGTHYGRERVVSPHTNASAFTDQPLVDYVNKERQVAGKAALREDTALDDAAKAKFDHMLANHYWAHVAPDGTAYSDFIWKAKPYSTLVGENLAKCYTNNTDMTAAWMASPGHKENILGDYTMFGQYTGKMADGCYYSVTNFAR